MLNIYVFIGMFDIGKQNAFLLGSNDKSVSS